MKLDRQRAFETAVTHLIEQNEQSHHNGICVYRGPNGTKCAVGALISDDEYDPLMETKNAAAVCQKFGILTDDLNDQDFLTMMQKTIHDRYDPKLFTSFSEFVKQKSIDFAKLYGLNTSFIRSYDVG